MKRFFPFLGRHWMILMGMPAARLSRHMRRHCAALTHYARNIRQGQRQQFHDAVRRQSTYPRGIEGDNSMLLGVFYGGVAGYSGGKTDMLMMRTVDVMYAVPSLLYIILLMLILGANVGSIMG